MTSATAKVDAGLARITAPEPRFPRFRDRQYEAHKRFAPPRLIPHRATAAGSACCTA